MEKFSSLDNILQAFSVEPLNKEFYGNIQEQFYQLVGGEIGEGKKKKVFKATVTKPPCKR
ncbi:MAG: hypothetical protein CSA45_05420 [Gammaproteobacteria bacterium]|nr:MAG: hypothetical protein CSA45_05420 [Gammaproteobacteria bacterium]